MAAVDLFSHDCRTAFFHILNEILCSCLASAAVLCSGFGNAMLSVTQRTTETKMLSFWHHFVIGYTVSYQDDRQLPVWAMTKILSK